MMKLLQRFVLLLLVTVAFVSMSPKKKERILIFSKTAGYHHASIATGIEAIKKIGMENGFAVDTTTDSTAFTYKNLKQYSAVLFLSTTGELFSDEERTAFQKYIHKGGGFIGVHAATDCEFNWPWYGRLVGAYFTGHPVPQQAKLMVVDSNHAATRMLPPVWTRLDEWYNFKDLNPAVHVLITLDETSYQGGKNGTNHPVAWWQNFEGGRMFYTALGHTEESYSELLFLQHLTGGILFVLGRK